MRTMRRIPRRARFASSLPAPTCRNGRSPPWNSMNAPSRAARFFKIGVGLFLMASGLAVTALLFIPYRKAMETRAWTETPCEILESYRQEEQQSEFSQPVQRVFIKY